MIEKLIPQRDPFLFVADEYEVFENEIKTSYTFSKELDFFKGHFPSNPIVPGVILSEHCFQSAAALMGYIAKEGLKSLAVVSRIQSAKFKKMVKVDETIHTKTTLIEEMGNAAFFKSIVTSSEGLKVLIIEFACTIVTEE
ncbi:MAG: beta-hydroxyacyl-ACP dehydratase [Halobacteriovoraceae bacterium]|nr:beta-hydroxyacyl-ACP dehydratase [Halobacteriovoraceae bacterium]|tara:strand:- start:9507 stop:9926 length:420 start_codon:yes stop_codon:yes gene_type:complete